MNCFFTFLHYSFIFQEYLCARFLRSEMQVFRLIFSGLLLLLLPLNAVAQGDTLQANTQKDNHSLYTGTGYGSNMIYLGSTISRDLPFGYGALSYLIGGELSLTGAAFYLPGLEQSAPSFYSASMAYSHDFNSWFDISAGLSRYMVKPELTDTLFSNFNYADLSLGIDWRILYTELSYGAFVMREPPAYFQVKNSRYFETPSFFKGKATFSFGPYANLLFGDLTTASIMEGTELITTTRTLVTPVSVPVTSGSGMGQGPGSGQGQGSTGNHHNYNYYHYYHHRSPDHHHRLFRKIRPDRDGIRGAGII